MTANGTLPLTFPKIIAFTVHGKPQQRGSKQAGVRYGRDGKPMSRDGRILTFAKDMNEKSSEWMNLVRDKAVEAMEGQGPVRGPVVLTARFCFARPQGHFGTGRNRDKLKPSAPKQHFQTPDLSKLLRCIEDGMSEIVYADDRQISEYGAKTGKYWTTGNPRVEIVVEEIG